MHTYTYMYIYKFKINNLAKISEVLELENQCDRKMCLMIVTEARNYV